MYVSARGPQVTFSPGQCSCVVTARYTLKRKSHRAKALRICI